MSCDCTVFCGDDPWLRDGTGRARPCRAYTDDLEARARATVQGNMVAKLCKQHGAKDAFDLVCKLQARGDELEARK